MANNKAKQLHKFKKEQLDFRQGMTGDAASQWLATTGKQRQSNRNRRKNKKGK